MEDIEIWKDVVGYEGYYWVSNHGRVKNRRIIFNQNPKHSDYLPIGLYKEGDKIKKYTPTHRLVAFAFIPNPENKPFVNHKDLNRQNNHVSNLEWVTHRENILHAIEALRHLRVRKTCKVSYSPNSYAYKMLSVYTLDELKEISKASGVSYSHIKRIVELKSSPRLSTIKRISEAIKEIEREYK